MANLQQKHTTDRPTQNAMEGVTESEAASMTVKVSLERGSGDNEIRRFLVAGDANYNKLKNKIGKMFPNCPAEFNVLWTDSDGDNIVISSNEELQLAISNRTDDILRLKMKVNINCEENNHPGHRVQRERLMLLEHAAMQQMPAHARPCMLKKQGDQSMAPGNSQVAPFPCWSGMMTRIWQNRAKQLWLETSGEPVSKEMEQNVMNRWMVTMGNAWKELVGKQPDHQSKRRWREAVINCCNKLKKSSEEKSSPEDCSQKMLDTDAQSADDTSGTEGGKQDEMKEKRKMWRKTMRQCWQQADKKDAKKEEKRGNSGRVKDRESGNEYKKQWRQMMRQMMHGDCPTSREEMKEKKETMKIWWRKQQKKNDKEMTSDSSSNESLDSEVAADYIHVSVDSETDINMKDSEHAEPPSEENIHHLPLTRPRPTTMVFKATCDDGPQLRPAGEPDTVALAVDQLKMMGFSDEGGWLTRLTQAKQADVNKVLDSLKPAYQ